jgi:hypothetical protein
MEDKKMIRTKRKCACGCGGETKRIKKGKFNKFISGHNSKAGGNPFIGKKHSEETKQKIREKAIGRIVSIETREKISKAGIGRIVSDKTREKIGEHRRLSDHPLWKGGVMHAYGRIFIRIGPKKYKARSRIVIEQSIGRELLSHEIVHHINGIPDDDRIENLMVTIRASHVRIHHTGAKRSEETKKRIGAKSKGRECSEETKRKISQSLKNGRCKNE